MGGGRRGDENRFIELVEELLLLLLYDVLQVAEVGVHNVAVLLPPFGAHVQGGVGGGSRGGGVRVEVGGASRGHHQGHGRLYTVL